MPETYIITPDYNGEKFLKKYFNSILDQSYTDFRMIFVDNSSENNSINYIHQNYAPQLDSGLIKIIKNPENYGFAKANNQGIKEAFKDPECRYIICLNNDTEVKEDFLEHLILYAQKHPEAGSIQPKMIWGQNPDLIDSVGLEYSRNGLGFNRGAYKSIENFNEEEEILGCCAGACLYRREALEDIKLGSEYFDEEFFAYYEDFDLALRLRWAGWSAWYCPDAVLWHYRGGTKKPLSNFTLYYSWRNYTWNLWKNIPTNYIFRNLHLIITCELIQIIYYLFKGKTIILKSKFDAYKDLRRFNRKKRHIKKKIAFNEWSSFFIYKWRI